MLIKTSSLKDTTDLYSKALKALKRYGGVIITDKNVDSHAIPVTETYKYILGGYYPTKHKPIKININSDKQLIDVAKNDLNTHYFSVVKNKRPNIYKKLLDNTRYSNFDKSKSRALKALTIIHELMERKSSRVAPISPLGKQFGHWSITDVVGRGEHGNLIKPNFQTDERNVAGIFKTLRYGREATILKKLTPKNINNIKVEYGNPNSIRINRSLALRMRAKELGIDITGKSAKQLKQEIYKQKKKEQKKILNDIGWEGTIVPKRHAAKMKKYLQSIGKIN
jgi:hypothetical protein